MALRVVKNDNGENNKNKSSSNGIYIIQVKNQKGEIGYVGKHLGKIFVFGNICSEVVKFDSVKEAKELAKTISNVQTEIIGKHKIEKIIEKQNNLEVTIPIEDIEGSLYCVIVIDTDTNEKIGYIGYKPELKQYYVITEKTNVAFWEGKENAEEFINGSKSLIAKYSNLKLEIELLKE